MEAGATLGTALAIAGKPQLRWTERAGDHEAHFAVHVEGDDDIAKLQRIDLWSEMWSALV